MVSEDGEVVEDAVVRRTEPGAVDLVGEEGDELQSRGVEAVARGEPVLRQEPACCHRRRDVRRRRRRVEARGGVAAGEESYGPVAGAVVATFVSTLNRVIVGPSVLAGIRAGRGEEKQRRRKRGSEPNSIPFQILSLVWCQMKKDLPTSVPPLRIKISVSFFKKNLSNL